MKLYAVIVVGYDWFRFEKFMSAFSNREKAEQYAQKQLRRYKKQGIDYPVMEYPIDKRGPLPENPKDHIWLVTIEE